MSRSLKRADCIWRRTWATLANVITLLTRSPDEAAAFIRRGGIVAFPTETVYGLGADAFDESAIGKVFTAKDRPPDNPLIAHVHAQGDIEKLAALIPESAKKLIDAFFPGPLTIVLKKNDRVPILATAGLDTIGIRMPGNAIAQEFLRACGRPVVAPSANLSGRPSPTTWEAVFEDLDGRIDCILQSDATEIGLESTVVDCTAERPVLLRKGAVSLERLRAVVPEIDVLDTGESETPRSPGLKHKHYAPNIAVIVIRPGEKIRGDASDAYIGLTRRANNFKHQKVATSVEDYARSLFEFFRECERMNVKRIFCETVDESEIGSALMDRIRRAAAG